MTDELKADNGRQHLSGMNLAEREVRERDTEKLIHDLIGHHQEFFNDPENRLNFLEEMGAAGLYKIARHINAKLRGEKPRELWKRRDQIGASLPLLHTPSPADKPEAFRRGYDALREYIDQSSDDITKKNSERGCGGRGTRYMGTPV